MLTGNLESRILSVCVTSTHLKAYTKVLQVSVTFKTHVTRHVNASLCVQSILSIIFIGPSVLLTDPLISSLLHRLCT